MGSELSDTERAQQQSIRGSAADSIFHQARKCKGGELMGETSMTFLKEYSMEAPGGRCYYKEEGKTMSGAAKPYLGPYAAFRRKNG